MPVECISKCVIILVNVFFGLIGFILLAAGGFAKLGSSMINTFLQPVLSSLNKLPGASGVSTPTIDIGALLGTVATVLIVVGVILLAISIFGCIAACCTIRVLLMVYAVILGVLLLGEVLAVIIIIQMKPQLDTQLKGQLNATIQANYKGITGTNMESLAWNFVMVQFKCCGVDSYWDFYAAPYWNRTFVGSYGGVAISTTLVTPAACCKMNGTFPSVTPSNVNCTFTPDNFNSNWNTGCYTAVWNFLDVYMWIVQMVVACLGIFLLAMFIFTVVLIVKSKSAVDPL